MHRKKRPKIDGSSFGSITVDGERYDHDIFITLGNQVKKRNKKLSKAVYGTSHTLSLPEIEYVYQKEAEVLVIGSGQYGVARLSNEAESFLFERGCTVSIRPTPEAITEWNRMEGKHIGIFHITC